jgi:TolA-binding protein
VKTSLEDLSARARRGQLGDTESSELERLLETSLEARLAHRAGLEFDREDSVLVGDHALAERINRRLIAPRPRARTRRRRVVALVVGGVCTAMAAAAGPALVDEWTQAWPIFVGTSMPKETAPPRPRSTPGRTVSKRAEAQNPPPAPVEQRPVFDEQTLAKEQAADQKHAMRAQSSSAGRTRSTARGQANAAQEMSSSLESSATLFAQASLLRREGQSGRAIELYSQLLERYPRSAEAGSAQIALAMLYLQSGAAGSALTYFNRYLAEDPGGQLAAEALWGKTRALTALGHDEEARRGLLRLVKRYPRSTYATAARAKLGFGP